MFKKRNGVVIFEVVGSTSIGPRMEGEILAWLKENPKIKPVEILQSLSDSGNGLHFIIALFYK